MTDAERDAADGNTSSAQYYPRPPQQEPDIHNFSTSSPHRLATISGTQALQNELRRARGITTSLLSLDASLLPTGSNLPSSGIRLGYVTEIYGPPGVGKTTFGMQLVANVLHSTSPDAKVVWLNTGSPLVHARLTTILSSYTLPSNHEPPSSPPRLQSMDALISRIHYRELTLLPHLLTLITHPTSLFPPPKTTLLIIDDLSNLIFSSLPHPAPASKSDPVASAISKRESARRIQIVESLSSALSSLAAGRHIAIVLLNKCTTAQRPGAQAMLKPALAGQAWDPSVYARIVLYRDLPPWNVRDSLGEDERKGYRLAEVVRLGNKDVVRSPVPFVIKEGGLREITVPKDHGARESLRKEKQHEEDAIAISLSVLPPMEEQPGKQLVNRGESEPGNLGPGLEKEPELPPIKETVISAKRKAIEIADSDDEADQSDEASEPELPRILSARRIQDEGSEEMLFDEHERQLTQRPAQP